MPNDFIVMDIEEDTQVPIILGRPFLATAGACIDVREGLLTFDICGEKVKFDFSSPEQQGEEVHGSVMSVTSTVLLEPDERPRNLSGVKENPLAGNVANLELHESFVYKYGDDRPFSRSIRVK